MIIKKRPVISWLLNDKDTENSKRLAVPYLANREHWEYLSNGMYLLAKIHDESNPNWGLPEIIMPSYEEVMKKSAKSFFSIDHQIFKDLSDEHYCGILISEDSGTIVYGFADCKLHVWVFRENSGFSELYLYFYIESTEDNTRKIYTWPTLTQDPQLFNQECSDVPVLYELFTNKLMVYLAVRKYVKVETIKIPDGQKIKMENRIEDYHGKCKIVNYSGQEVIVMDSRWFRKIVNDNDIFVRGFFRLQNKKDESGKWYKELIFVDSYIRHGYHRNAEIEEGDTNEGVSNN